MQTYLKIHHEACDKKVSKELFLPALSRWQFVDPAGENPWEAGNEPGSPGLRRLAAAARGSVFRALGGSTTPRNPHRILQQDVQPGAGWCLCPPGVPT